MEIAFIGQLRCCIEGAKGEPVPVIVDPSAAAARQDAVPLVESHFRSWWVSVLSHVSHETDMIVICTHEIDVE